MATTEVDKTRLDTFLPWVGLAARLLVGGVWVVAGALKVSDLNQSVYAVQAYQLLPSSLAEIVGVLLPLIEVGIGLLLILGLATVPAAVISGLLMVAFIIGIAAAWARGLQIDCGCFGGGGEVAEGVDPGYLQEILRDVGLLLCSALLVWRPGTKFSADQLIFKTK
jgi:uncharacterized membrane protein YphA (DoxX/SURF4 family)